MTTATRTEGARQTGGLSPDPAGRIEGVVQVLILVAVGGMAGAASFTHVHDWTMTHSPDGTPGWFGWGNAVISELTPLAAGLEIRRRRRFGLPVGYPLAVLIAAAVLSLSAQVAVAKPSPTGWLLAAVPALAFLALSKLVLGRKPATETEPEPVEVPPVVITPEPSTVAEPALAVALDVPAHLVTGARFAATAHEQATGLPITPDDLASRMNVTPATAAGLLAALDERPQRINGTPVGGAS